MSRWTRRRFISSLVGVFAGVLAACRSRPRRSGEVTVRSEEADAPVKLPAVLNDHAPTPRPKPVVAIASCEDYGPQKVEAVVRELVALCGGLGDIVRPGSTVVIKPNITAGGRSTMPDGLPNILTYTTHPDVTRAIALLAKEAGAARVIVTEGWGLDIWAGNAYQAMIQDLGLEVLNLDDPAPAANFVSVPVPGAYELQEILFNEVIAKADVLVSVPKIKCHASAGITLSIKNIFGCTPLPAYRDRPTQQSRTTMHAGNWSERLPRILVDVLQARPIDFCVVDGISTIDQGEGPWNDGVGGIEIRTVRPHLLMAGRNPVAVDAVGAAVMGFDPLAEARTAPFSSGLNHLALAAAQGIGPNQLDRIEVRGLSIEEALFPFTPCPDLAMEWAGRTPVAMPQVASPHA